MLRICVWVGLFALAMLSAPVEARRVALLIGAVDYKQSEHGVGRLASPIRDAEAVMSVLVTHLGFAKDDIELLRDPNKGQIEQAVVRFAERAKSAEVAVFYFSGHGASTGEVNSNYLLPVSKGANFRTRLQLINNGYPLELAIETVRSAAPQRALFIVDACRTLMNKGDVKGMARISPSWGTEQIVAHLAAQPDAGAADDSSNGLSLYTYHLVKHLPRAAEQPLQDLLDDVRDEVYAASNQEQRPSRYGEIRSNLRLVGAPMPGRATQTVSDVQGAANRREQRPGPSGANTYPSTDSYNYGDRNPANPTIRHVAQTLGGQGTSPAVGSTIKDCEVCPELLVLPKVSFTMGAPEAERAAFKAGSGADEWLNWSQPQRRLTMDRTLAVGKYHVTKGQYALFVRATGRGDGDGCNVMKENGVWEKQSDKSWRNPGFGQEDNHPVVCVNWEDAKAYVTWLNNQAEIRRLTEGQRYRLLTEGEWEYAARAETSTRYWWGEGEKNDQQCRYANGADVTKDPRDGGQFSSRANCADGYFFTSPVGKYQANGWGLFDMSGNAWQWVEDCWVDSLNGMPSNGTARTSSCTDPSLRVLRGGSWSDGPQFLRAADRDRVTAGGRNNGIGFRVARTVNL